MGGGVGGIVNQAKSLVLSCRNLLKNFKWGSNHSHNAFQKHPQKAVLRVEEPRAEDSWKAAEAF